MWRPSLQLSAQGLSHVVLAHCTALRDKTLGSLGGQPLQLLDLSEAASITDAGLALLCDATGTARKTLSDIRLSGCRQVTDAGVDALGGCLCLQRVDISGCCLLTDQAGTTLAGLDLRHLDLEDCSAITDATLQQLGASVEHLDATLCTAITDIGVEAVASSCPNLKYLSLRGCTSVTDLYV